MTQEFQPLPPVRSGKGEGKLHYVGFNKAGRGVLSTSAYEYLERPQAVIFALSRDESQFAIFPAEENELMARPIRKGANRTITFYAADIARKFDLQGRSGRVSVQPTEVGGRKALVGLTAAFGEFFERTWR
ncbi:MAG: hypothetical protein KM296_00035 [Brockia lithotrophica]|nr:hypothetical protein [Brockia lithotrophica]